MDDPRIYKRTLHRFAFSSESLRGSRQVTVYLPPEYRQSSTYPVVYCQDGEQFFQFGRIATVANRLYYEDGIEPPIIVGIATDPENRSAEYDPDGALYERYEHFFVEELLPYIEERFPIQDGVGGRILAGDSLAAALSLHVALNHRKLFARVLALSGAFYEASLHRLALESDLSWLEVYMTVGLDERGVNTSRGVFDFVELNRRARELLEDRQAAVVYTEKPGKHLWGFWQKELPDALRYFLEGRAREST
jgi:enterochelin esterase-like enzyme